MTGSYEEITDTSRRKILGVLGDDAKTVNQIVKDAGLKQPNVSNHLRRMRTRGIVKSSKVGRQVFYSVASPEIRALVNSVITLNRDSPEELNYEDVSQRLYEASIAGEEDIANSILDEAFRANQSLLDIYDRLLAPAMRLVGVSYSGGRITESEEHMASEIVLRLMARTVRIPGPPKRIGRSCIVGCIPNDYHVIGPRMAADYLRLSGWKTLFCGGNVPIRSFLTAVYQNQPDMVLIGCAIQDGYELVDQLIRELRHLNRGGQMIIGLGGNIPTRLYERFIAAGADFICTDLRYFAEKILPEIEATGSVSSEIGWAC